MRKRISVVETINEEIEGLAGNVGSKFGCGGMITKITAARIAVNAGIPLMIGHGAEDNILRRLTSGEDVGTLFLPVEMKPHLRKKLDRLWLSCGGPDSCGRRAPRRRCCTRARVCCPAGLPLWKVIFRPGAVVEIADLDGQGVCPRALAITAG